MSRQIWNEMSPLEQMSAKAMEMCSSQYREARKQDTNFEDSDVALLSPHLTQDEEAKYMKEIQQSIDEYLQEFD
ncbi:hypothetical protein CYMTET_51195 [Cymbomonas tetramitiformis]|uniref:Uncharacterized protein n=1 Tax=Cymbomonas tetramitiformis TaxID=36881 RepID=A0AAE0BNI9_9CHLO|nr:hypothetical protein CYMTET_51195 [Cymbomonas tetramitiformis]